MTEYLHVCDSCWVIQFDCYSLRVVTKFACMPAWAVELLIEVFWYQLRAFSIDFDYILIGQVKYTISDVLVFCLQCMLIGTWYGKMV